MTWRLFLFFFSFVLVGCASSGGRFSYPYATGYYGDAPIQCVPYARQNSNIQIYGDAYTWWAQAENKYMRGNMPQPGAVLVLKQRGGMSHGHVAVVKKVINSREINVTHSNWGSDRKNRSMVYESVRVRDVSPNNNWSAVQFWYVDTKNFGSTYPAYGFIYPS